MRGPKARPTIDTSLAGVRPRVNRPSVAFTAEFNRLVDDVFRLRHPAVPGRPRLGDRPLNAPGVNGARLHTVAFAHMRNSSVAIFDQPSVNLPPFVRWTSGFLEAGAVRLAEVRELGGSAELLERVRANIQAFYEAREAVIREAETGHVSAGTLERFVLRANNFIGNVYDVGAHVGVNVQVSANLHLNFEATDEGEALTPGSHALARGFSEAAQLGGVQMAIPLSPGGSRVVGHHTLVAFPHLAQSAQDLVASFNLVRVGVQASAMDAFRQNYVVDGSSSAPAPLKSTKRSRDPFADAASAPVKRAAKGTETPISDAASSAAEGPATAALRSSPEGASPVPVERVPFQGRPFRLGEEGGVPPELGPQSQALGETMPAELAGGEAAGAAGGSAGGGAGVAAEVTEVAEFLPL